MSGLAWSPAPWAALLLAAVALAAWVALAPPARRAPLRSALRLGALLLVVLALLDVGPRGAAAGSRPRLAVLVDRSLSMEVADGGASRAEAARAWLDGDAFARWSAGWDVAIDSFGGATSDPGAAVAAALAERPGAVLLVSDGRAAGGRAAEAAGVPLHAWAPGPVAVADLAIVDVEIAEDGASAVVEVAAAGGLPVPAGRRIALIVDGRPAATAEAGRVDAGERRRVRLPLPGRGGERLVEARLEGGADAVTGNDARARVDAAGDRAGRHLVVGLAPGWELGALRRALGAARAPVDAVWSPAPGRLRGLDGGPLRAWGALPPARYDVVWLVGDPARLGADGAAWLARWRAPGGRGLAWLAAGSAGDVAGLALPGPPSAAGAPAATAAGAAWLAAHGAPAPGDLAGWPPLELLPGSAPGPGATTLVLAAGRAAAWVEERGAERRAVLAGTGWYRWPLRGGAPAEAWDAWVDALARWLGASGDATAPLVRLPAGRRVARGEPLVARAAGGDAALAWRVEAADGSAVDEGTLAPGAAELRTGPLEPGAYALVAESGARRARARFVVETWAPDLAWTAADTASLAAAARASGGSLLAADLPGRLAPPAAAPVPAGTRAARGLGRSPWAPLLAALLVLGDWALGARALARREGEE